MPLRRRGAPSAPAISRRCARAKRGPGSAAPDDDAASAHTSPATAICPGLIRSSAAEYRLGRGRAGLASEAISAIEIEIAEALEERRIRDAEGLRGGGAMPLVVLEHARGVGALELLEARGTAAERG